MVCMEFWCPHPNSDRAAQATGKSRLEPSLRDGRLQAIQAFWVPTYFSGFSSEGRVSLQTQLYPSQITGKTVWCSIRACRMNVLFVGMYLIGKELLSLIQDNSNNV